jgi:hypothetical protein
MRTQNFIPNMAGRWTNPTFGLHELVTSSHRGHSHAAAVRADEAMDDLNRQPRMSPLLFLAVLFPPRIQASPCIGRVCCTHVVVRDAPESAPSTRAHQQTHRAIPLSPRIMPEQFVSEQPARSRRIGRHRLILRL